MHSLLLSLVVFFPFWALAQVAEKVAISAGAVQGALCPNSEASRYLNIPYAQPPTGDLRFAPPQAYSQKFPSGIYNATTPGPACIQFGGTFLESGPTSEDCLHLDIWVPRDATSESALPVKVWIYGGGEDSGGISNPLYDGCNLAAHGTIVVSINYRLGPLGFLALESAGIGGNFGIQDILLGLQWIQSNIAEFGGNPKKVLLFGQSAGATNTFIISTLPQARSLISAAISESGGGRDVATNAVVQPIGERYASSLNCGVKDISCLRSKSVLDLNATNPEFPGTIIYSGINANAFQPYIDGKTIPAQPSAVGSKVPAIFGSNTNEGALFVLGQYQNPVIPDSQYTQFLNDNFGSAAPSVAKAYPLSAFNGSSPYPVFTAMSTIITDVSYFCPAYRALNLAIRNGIPAWTYLFDHTPSCGWFDFIPKLALPLFQATHTAEIPFVFGNLANLPLPNGNCTLSDSELDISVALITAWSAMAATGNPDSSSNSFQWPPYNTSHPIGLTIGNSTTVGPVDYSACKFWDDLDTTTLNFTTSNNSTGGSSSTNTTGSATSAADRSISDPTIMISLIILGISSLKAMKFL